MNENGNKTILMLGGSTQQVTAIRKAKEMGYRTVLIDYLPDNPGQFVADRWYCQSTTDMDAVFNIAKKEKVSGILPYASDPAALPAAIVCERLGLPTNPAKSVEILGVKHKFRKFLQDNGFVCPKTFSFNLDTPLKDIINGIEGLKFPLVIKPTDSSGSKGVTFIQDVSELLQAIDFATLYSRNKVLLAEEYIFRGYPHVIGGDIFVENGKIIVFGIMECLRDNGGESLIPIGEKRPCGLNANQIIAVQSELQRLISCLDIRNGELNVEVLIDINNQPNFLELGPRAGGNMIPVQLSDIFGVDLVRANVAVAMGENVDLKVIEPVECFMTFVLHSHEDGFFAGIEFSPEIEKNIYRKVIYKKLGDKVEKFDNAGNALGIIFMRFPSKEVMDITGQNIDRLITIKLQ